MVAPIVQIPEICENCIWYRAVNEHFGSCLFNPEVIEKPKDGHCKGYEAK